MYGILLSCIIDYIEKNYGNISTREIVQIDEYKILDDNIYPDEIMDLICKELSEHNFYEKIGKHIVKYLQGITYGPVFLSHWTDYRDFLLGLDKLDDYLRVYCPRGESPLFTCKEETESGMKLECICKDENLINFALGLVHQVSLSVYLKEVELVVVKTSHVQDICRVLIDIQFSNKYPVESCAYYARYNFPVDRTQLGYIFPYSLVISSDMRIINLGVSLLAAFPEARGQHLSRVVSLRRPKIALDLKSIVDHSKNVYEFIMKYRPFTRTRSLDLNLYVPQEEIYYLRLKGRMLFLKDWNILIYIGSPIFSSLSCLTSLGFNISDLTIHDFSRDMMLAEAQQTAELRMTFDQGKEKQKKLKYFLLKLDEEMKRMEAILHEMVPGKSAFGYNEGSSTLKLLENVSVLISDIVKFTIVCSLLKPMEVVSALNTMYSKFDLLTAKHGVYKVETIGDAYMVVSTLSGENCPQKICDIALDMRESIKEVIDPNTGSHLMIRIGVHTGPVIAGVVGLKVPKFCLFGRTVKTAVLLEASSQPMKIKISWSTKDSLPSYYKTEESDMIIHNGERISTCWLISGGRE